MKKVLFIVPSLCQGGMSEALVFALNSIDRNKNDIYLFLCKPIFTLRHKVPEDVKIVVDKKKAHYHISPKALMLRFRKCVYRFLHVEDKEKELEKSYKEYIHSQRVMHPYKKYFRDTEFDVVISYAWGIYTEMAANMRSHKKYVFMHGSIDMHHDLMERLLPEFDGIVAVSRGVQNMLKEAYPNVRNKVLLLENYLDAEKVIELSKDPVTGISVDEKKTIICSCGRLFKSKGFDIAIEAAKMLRDDGLDFVWLFVGGDDGDLLRLQDMIKKYSLQKEILFTGFKKNPFPYINMCNIYVQPSYEESYGLTIEEAQILGKPVVSTKTIGGIEVLENGKKGVLTDISGEGVFEGIRKLINDPSLRRSFENIYSFADNIREKEIYIDTWELLLS